VSGLRSVVRGVIWLAVIVVIALGAAGLVSAIDHAPGTLARAELTAAGDAEVSPLLDAAETDFAALADQVEALGAQARGALAALNGSDDVAGEAAIERGNQLVADVAARTRALRRELATVPYVGTPEAGLTVSDGVVARHATLVSALDATDGLDVAWIRLTVGSVAIIRMSGLLAEHDQLVAQAADRGVHARYADAITLLDAAGARIAAARTQRNQLVATVDVTVLDEWLTRNENYDTALRNLYQDIATVGTTVTPEIKAAIKAEADARARLPADTRGLVIIMADIGRGGMNGAVIAIEEARAKLTDALDTQTSVPSAEPDATGSP
jgi:hypothetical protein